MNGAGILPNDLVLVKKQNVAKAGETIVALIGEEATVKYLQKRGKEFFLEAANINYDPIRVDENVSIIGRVISVVRRF